MIRGEDLLCADGALECVRGKDDISVGQQNQSASGGFEAQVQGMDLAEPAFG